MIVCVVLVSLCSFFSLLVVGCSLVALSSIFLVGLQPRGTRADILLGFYFIFYYFSSLIQQSQCTYVCVSVLQSFKYSLTTNYTGPLQTWIVLIQHIFSLALALALSRTHTLAHIQRILRAAEQRPIEIQYVCAQRKRPNI